MLLFGFLHKIGILLLFDGDLSTRWLVPATDFCVGAAVEQRRRPELRGKPVAVVQFNPWKGGGLIAVSYEARKCGVLR